MKVIKTEGAENLPDFERRCVYCSLDNMFTYEVEMNMRAGYPTYMNDQYESIMAMVPPLLYASIHGMEKDEQERKRQLGILERGLRRSARLCENTIRSAVPFDDWIKMVQGSLKPGSVPYKRKAERYTSRPLAPSDNAKTAISKPLLTKILYDYLGLPAKKGKNKKSKSGRSVDEEAITALMKEKKAKPYLILLRAMLKYTEWDKQASYLRGPWRKGRWTYVIAPGKETFRIAGSKDQINTDVGVLV